MSRRLPPVVIALGSVSLLTDVATEMIVPVLPIFLTGTLGASAAFLGIIEGVADSVAAVFKGFGGVWSDGSHSRRRWILGGYGLSSLARPFIALAAAPWHVLALRSIDRAGKGLRTAPRDALLAAAVAPESRGWAFGFHRAMDHTGALLGGLLAAGLLYWGMSDRAVIAWAAAPGMLAVAMILFFVREPAVERPAPAVETGRPGFSWSALPAPLRRYILIAGVFALANSSDAFLLLKAHETGIPLVALPLLWAWIHVARIVSNLAGGWASDRIGPRRLVIAGWAVYALVYVLVALSSQPWHIWTVLGLYGIYSGLTEGGEKAIVAALAPQTARGSAFGAFHFVTGVAALPASALTGLIWYAWNSTAALIVCAATAAISAGLLLTCRVSDS